MKIPALGETFAQRYRIVRPLGQGGFATVFLAADLSIGRDVVLKILEPSESGYEPHVEARFMREAKILAELQDPHIVTMYEFGRAPDGLLFMVFEYLVSRDLSLVIHEHGPITPAIVVRVMEQMLHALREAHAHSYLHRDVKPANVLIYEHAGDPWRVKLIDFGIAKPKRPDMASLTRTGRVVGTLRYMAPEQLMGDEVSAASDIFSVGLVAFEMLTGRPAIAGTDQKELIESQVSDRALRLPEDCAPAALRAVVEKMIARDQVDRYQSVNDVLAALRTGSVRDRTPEPPAPAPARTPPERRPAQRNWVRVAIVGAVVCLSGLAGVTLMRRLEPPRPPPPASPATRPNPLLTQSAPQRPRIDAPTSPQPAPTALVDGCGHDPPFLGVGSMTSGAYKWAAHIPDGYDPNVRYPVVLMFHRSLRGPFQIIEESRIGPVADANGFLVLAFLSENPTGWSPAMVPQVELALREAKDQLCIDSTRLFAVGDEAGAHMVMLMACKRPLSAVAVGWDNTSRNCTPVVPTPRLRWYGTRDLNVPAQGGWGCNILAGEHAAAADIESGWKKVHQCRGRPKSWKKHPTGECVEWTCKEAPLLSCETNLSHQWPGSRAPVEIENCVPPSVDAEFPLAETIWAFFEEHGRPIDGD